ncbi:hypothetical protein NXS19_011929 [Fusarium pseudograminearum]|nr:hypothetical protein NXS19_011929 [Fusarium pseudograminearum]
MYSRWYRYLYRKIAVASASAARISFISKVKNGTTRSNNRRESDHLPDLLCGDDPLNISPRKLTGITSIFGPSAHSLDCIESPTARSGRIEPDARTRMERWSFDSKTNHHQRIGFSDDSMTLCLVSPALFVLSHL